MNPLAIFRTKPKFFASNPRWTGCTPLSAAERMACYSAAHAQLMQERENAGAAMPKVRLVDGRAVLVALDGRPNEIKGAKSSE